VQLIDAATDRHIWAERYDRELQDIFAIQDEISRAIVATLPNLWSCDLGMQFFSAPSSKTP
jgi:TolB-like protein